MIDKLIHYLQCIPMEDKNKFGNHIEISDDIAHDYLTVSTDDSGNYYRIDVELEEINDDGIISGSHNFKRLESVEGVSYWNWDDDECLKIVDTTNNQLTELLTYLPDGEI